MTCFNKFAFLLGLISLCALLGCKPEVANTPLVTTPVVLDGEWSVVEAYKGKTLSRLLDNGKFKFTEDKKFSTNILGDESLYPYTVTKSKIRIENNKKDNYIVQYKTSDTLILTTRLRNFDFKFITVKSNLEE